MLFKEERTTHEERFVESVLEQSELIARAHASLRQFSQIITERDETALGPWAREAEASRIPNPSDSSSGCGLIGRPKINALLFASSQGQVEGQVKRLKVFKRQGYGRASPALLQARLVGAKDLYRN